MVDAVKFGTVPPTARGTPTPYSQHVPDQDLEHMLRLVRSSVVGPPSFYNTHSLAANGPEYAFGATRDWLAAAIDEWVNKFDWRAHEKHWNLFPQFTLDVTAPSDGEVFHLHFAALFSRKEDAIPIIFCHGWPSSWFASIPVLELLASKYTPETLPYHIIVPSLPDYGPSTRSKLTEKELDFARAAEALNELMKALGFNAYVAQGGDVGSGMAAALAVHDECKAVHFNNFLLTPSERASVANLPTTQAEEGGLALANFFLYGNTGYMLEQGTKPGAISLILESNPVAMLGWIGSMYAEGSTHSIDAILQQVSWYWLTQSYGRSLWPYRAGWAALLRDDGRKLPSPLAITTKPLGYSWYPGEVLTVAKSWMEHWFPENLVFYRAHESGGHFPAEDDTAGFVQDLEEFVAAAKAKAQF